KKQAEETASDIIAKAESTAAQIIEEARKSAKDEFPVMPESQSAAGGILEQVREKAERNAHIIKRQSDLLLSSAKKNKIAEDDVRAILDEVNKHMLSVVESLADPSTKSTKETSENYQNQRTEASKLTQSEPEVEEMSEQAEQSKQQENLESFHGTVELALPPPIGLDQMLIIHKQLKETPQVDVLNLGGSVDKGITIRVTIKSPISLISVLSEMPTVEKAYEESLGSNTVVPGRKGAEKGSLRRIIVTAKR
ncbi:MAG: hypothetical protein JSW38_07265, partial [Dehalococcoidia bacterium]